MKFIKYCVCIIAFIFPFISAMAQSLIKLADQPFKCEGCTKTTPTVSKKDLNKRISNDTSLQEALNKTKIYFTSEGDNFSVVCTTCPAPKILYHSNVAPSPKKPRGFITPYSTGSTTNYKGEENFYTLVELLDFLTESVLVIDTLSVSTADIIGKNSDVFSSFRATYRVRDSLIEKVIKYNPSTERFTLTRQSLFDQSLPFSVTDTLPVNIHYTSTDNEKIIVPKTMKVFFANPQEKKELTILAQTYKREFPGWSNEAIAEELLIPIQTKYKKASVANLTAWLQSVH